MTAFESIYDKLSEIKLKLVSKLDKAEHEVLVTRLGQEYVTL